MGVRLAFWILGAIAGLVGTGCGKPAPPPAPPPTPAPATLPEEVRPTTQELLLGEYLKLPLPNMPLSVRVPRSWKIEMAGPLMLLTGPTPSSQAMIQLAQRNAIPADRIAAFVDAAMRDQEQSEGYVKPADLRDAGGIKIMERILVFKPTSVPLRNARDEPVLNEKGEPALLTTTPMRWTLTAFVPDAKGVNRYELNLIGFVKEQYEADKGLLENILNSLVYEESGTGAPASSRRE